MSKLAVVATELAILAFACVPAAIAQPRPAPQQITAQVFAQLRDAGRANSREALLTLIPTLQSASETALYSGVLAELDAGRQEDAEGFLDLFVSLHTNYQRIAFAQAVCTRSRFSVEMADDQFQHVYQMYPNTVEGTCANNMLQIDIGGTRDDYPALIALAEKNQKAPLVQWALGIACRDHYRKTASREFSAIGVQAFERALATFRVGPVLMHHTYANMLSEEVDRPADALSHRKTAIDQEPRPWTYQGLANTLSALKRYSEASDAYTKCVELAPSDSIYWSDWALALRNNEQWELSIQKARRAVELDPKNTKARRAWAESLEHLGSLEEALAQYNEIINIRPQKAYAYDAAARVLELLGRGKDAEAVIKRKSAAVKATEE